MVYFIKDINNICKYRYQGVPYVAFLYRVASNECNSFFRRKAKTRSISIDSESCISLAQEINEPSVDFTPALLKILDQLSEDEVTFIELKYFEKCSVKEMAYILKISESNVKVKGHRLIQKLKKLKD